MPVKIGQCFQDLFFPGLALCKNSFQIDAISTLAFRTFPFIAIATQMSKLPLCTPALSVAIAPFAEALLTFRYFGRRNCNSSAAPLVR
jgi:hypothetical protein